MQNLSSQISVKKLKSTFVVGILSLLAIYILNKFYSGIVVARIPFLPIKLIQKLTHRGLSGENGYEAGFMFLYVLSGIVFRTNIQKIFDFEMPAMLYKPYEE